MQGPGPGRGHSDNAADGRLGAGEGPLAVEGRMVERGHHCCRNEWGEMVVSFRRGTFRMLPPPLLTCLTLDETSNLNFFLMYAAAAAKSFQSCPTLCDPIDGSPLGSPVPGILQARTLEWVAISFSNA